MNQKRYISLAIALSLLIGCSKNSTQQEGSVELSDTPISFGIEPNWDNASSVAKGEVTESFGSGDSFGVYAYNHFDDATTPYFSNLKVSYDGTSSWDSETTAYWPVYGSLSFYAYYPHSESTTFGQDDEGDPVLTYTVESNAANHCDLLIANSKEKTADDGEVEFTFQHAFSKIGLSFRNGSDIDGYVVKVTGVYLDNIALTASVDLSTNSVVASGSGEISATVSNGALFDQYIEYDATSGTSITSDNGYILIPPQTISDNAKLYVYIELYKVTENQVDTEIETIYTKESEYMATATLNTSFYTTIEAGKEYVLDMSYSISVDAGLTVNVVEVWDNVNNDNVI